MWLTVCLCDQNVDIFEVRINLWPLSASLYLVANLKRSLTNEQILCLNYLRSLHVQLGGQMKRPVALHNWTKGHISDA